MRIVTILIRVSGPKMSASFTAIIVQPEKVCYGRAEIQETATLGHDCGRLRRDEHVSGWNLEVYRIYLLSISTWNEHGAGATIPGERTRCYVGV